MCVVLLLSCSLPPSSLLPLPLAPAPYAFLSLFSFLPSLPSSPRTTQLPPPPNPTQSASDPIETQRTSLYPKRKRPKHGTRCPGVNGALLCSRRRSAFCTPRATFSWNSRSAPLSTSARHTCLSRARQYSPRAAPSCPFRRPLPFRHTPPFLTSAPLPPLPPAHPPPLPAHASVHFHITCTYIDDEIKSIPFPAPASHFRAVATPPSRTPASLLYTQDARLRPTSVGTQVNTYQSKRIERLNEGGREREMGRREKLDSDSE
ncbi:hypothetical protein B0H11DRAFT_2199248 [Mycena galericulata]|nr:hypothetical protein B0H11DRAFT_2199248 [Mycena galericulata]